jgi:hypothetical protein
MKESYQNDVEAVCDKYNIKICYRCNCRTRTYDLGHSRAHTHTEERKVCLAKVPATRISWFTFLHEVGHIVAEKADYGKGYPRTLAEHNATEWALAYMRDMRLPMPRKLLKGYRSYIKEKLDRGLRRGLQVVPVELRRY